MHRSVALVLSLLLVGPAMPVWCEPRVTEIFAFDNDTFVENLHLLPSGHLLLTTLASGRLLTLDPGAGRPAPRTLTDLPGSTGLTGIASLGSGRYAVSGGLHANFRFQRGSMKLYVVAVAAADATIVDVIPVPDTSMMNGLAPLPGRPHVVLSADSNDGRVLRIDTLTRHVSVAFADAALAPRDYTVFPLGINGLRIRGNHLYFTNSARGTFARVRIDPDGGRAGAVEVLARLPEPANGTYAYDDFVLDARGDAYVTLHPSSVMRVTTAGSQSTFVGGDADLTLKEPTSAALAHDGRSIYVSTGGANVTNQVYGGQIVKVRLGGGGDWRD